MKQTNPSIQNGIIAGVAGIILQMLLYFIQPKLLFNIAPWLVFIVVLVFMVQSANQLKKMNGGYLSLKEGLQQSWVTAILAIVILAIFKFLLYNVIDPGLTEKQLQVAIEQTEKITELFGGGDVDFDEMEDMMRDQMKLTLPKLLLGILVSIILHFIPAIIIAGITKNKKEEAEIVS